MEMINTILPALFYIFGIVLFIVMIILGIKVIQLLNRAEILMDNIENKVNTLNGLFSVINKATTSIELISNKVVSGIINRIERIFKRKKEEDYNE